MFFQSGYYSRCVGRTSLDFMQTGNHISWGSIYCSWDFIKENLRKIMQKFYQHIDCSTRAAKTLDQCYSSFRDAFKALPALLSANLIATPFCSSLPIGRNSNRKFPCWGLFNAGLTNQKGCFDHVDWDMFRVASENNIDEYTDTVTEFIRKCIGDVVPTETIKTYPNQKPWIDGSIRAKPMARPTTFNHG